MTDLSDDGIYYAQIRGFLEDQYCEKSAAVTWLLPTTETVFTDTACGHSGQLLPMTQTVFTDTLLVDTQVTLPLNISILPLSSLDQKKIFQDH